MMRRGHIVVPRVTLILEADGRRRRGLLTFARRSASCAGAASSLAATLK